MTKKAGKTAARVCVIGAGPSGIAAAKNCVQSGLEVVVFEKNNKVGGNWVFRSETGHSSVYENTHIISSRVWSEYEDFPMPDDYPDYPNHRQLQAYFESYARHFGVYEQIRFQHTVQHVERLSDGRWNVRYRDDRGAERQEAFDVLMVANGHHWDPKYPEYPGQFSGTFMHSHDFKGVTDEWRGKNVLVIGAGNSACDVAVESARVAGKVCLSMRSPQWFLPKFMFGAPTDAYAARTPWLPVPIAQFLFSNLILMLQGPFEAYNLPAPRRPIMTQHPTLNSDLIDFIRHGRIHPRPAIKALHGDEIEFVDGRREPFDIICACTGFWTTFPFFDESFINYKYVEKVPLFRRMMHPQYENLYFIGLFQPTGCIWPMADVQARLACAEILGRYRRPADMESAIREELTHRHADWDGGTRHAAEVDYHIFRRELKRELLKAGIDIGDPPKKDYYPAREGEPDLHLPEGRALYGIEVKIIDEDGRDLPHDGSTVGRLLVKGPIYANGLLAHPVPPDQAGWQASDYLASISPEGRVQIAGSYEMVEARAAA